MTRHDATQVITGYVDPSGEGRGNWSEETVVGRITNSGSWDRRYAVRCGVCGAPRHKQSYIVPKRTNQDSVSLREFGFALAVCLLLWGALLWALPILLIGMGWAS